jgi:hypothetical protein
MSARSYISVDESYLIISQATWTVDFGFFTISPATYAGPNPGTVVPVVNVVVVFDGPELLVQPATRADTKRTRIAREIFFMLTCMYMN